MPDVVACGCACNLKPWQMTSMPCTSEMLSGSQCFGVHPIFPGGGGMLHSSVARQLLRDPPVFAAMEREKNKNDAA